MKIHKFISEYLLSNTFIIEFENYDNVVLIDCGVVDFKPISNWLKKNNKSISHIFLTHSDTDHIAGINFINKEFDFKLIATEFCSNSIKSSKKNFSKYIPGFNGGFEVLHEVNIVSDLEKIKINGYQFNCIHTPGHTLGCMCIQVENLLFTGDTIIKGVKTRINNRLGGNIENLNISLEKLKKICNGCFLIYPGHGEEFVNNFI